MKEEITICWIRRDLRLVDNTALFHALQSSDKVMLLFIFDKEILGRLQDKSDKRVAFIHETLTDINVEANKFKSSIRVMNDSPLEAFKKLQEEFQIKSIFINHDYEANAIKRDLAIENFASSKNIEFYTFKDQVIFEKAEVMKKDGTPYTVFTPYSKIWKLQFHSAEQVFYPSENLLSSLYKGNALAIPTLNEIGFEQITSDVAKAELNEDLIREYQEKRDIPSVEGTTRMGIHLRFGTVSVRKLAQVAAKTSETWLNELIWREFFMMILFHYPKVEHQAFRLKYDGIKWRNNEEEFKSWCEGKTGYPIVDAGMRQLNETGWMHNRVRMVVASFLTKHLLIDWRWGEAYFAQKLLDYELSANNGNWQWAAGCGCDAAPYFRVFNPTLQTKKFDPKLIYIKRWIPEYNELYLYPIVDHDFARKRAIAAYKEVM
jgi:deoxyribodipyrimidine photo-lyase